MTMVQHKRRLVERYEIDTLGAPFKVTLLDCVTRSLDAKTGEEKINVPDIGGLIGAVLRARVSHPRKLNGDEIRFIRNALGLKANQLSKFLGMTPEHFSRCEASTKVMASLTERMFRLFAYLATYFADPQEMLTKILNGEASLELAGMEQKPTKKQEAMAKKFVEQFLGIKIQAVFDSTEELNFELRRSRPNDADPNVQTVDEEEWANEPPRAVAVG